VDKKRSGRDGQRLIEEFEGSGLTRRQFCERSNIPLTTLDYWRWKKMQASKPKPRLVEVAVEAPPVSPGFTITLRNGRRVEAAWGFDELRLSQLIRILESA
jgi:hypothetical protein